MIPSENLGKQDKYSMGICLCFEMSSSDTDEGKPVDRTVAERQRRYRAREAFSDGRDIGEPGRPGVVLRSEIPFILRKISAEHQSGNFPKLSWLVTLVSHLFFPAGVFGFFCLYIHSFRQRIFSIFEKPVLKVHLQL
jgi:hypothetical protein